MERDVAHSEMRTIDGRNCIVGNMVSFDVDDDYAFDVDGHGRLAVEVEPGAAFREATVTLDQAGGWQGSFNVIGMTEISTE